MNNRAFVYVSYIDANRQKVWRLYLARKRPASAADMFSNSEPRIATQKPPHAATSGWGETPTAKPSSAVRQFLFLVFRSGRD